MNPVNNAQRKKMIAWFAGFYFISILLTALICIYFQPSRLKQVTSPAPLSINQDHLIQSAQILQTHLKNLQQLYDKYAFSLGTVTDDSITLNDLSNTNAMISNEEKTLQAALDDIEFENANDLNASTLLNSITASYRLALNESKTISNIRTSLATGGISLNNEQQNLLAQKNDLQTGNSQLAEIQTYLKLNPDLNYSSTSTIAHDTSKQSNNVLRVALNLEKSKNVNLKIYNDKLKLDYDNLTDQFANLQKSSSSGNTKNSSAEIELLNAQVNFAQVDCNLTRADAKQIIYTSKQRRDLLQEALLLLNDLSKSGNSSIRDQANEKKAQLQKVASVIHD